MSTTKLPRERLARYFEDFTKRFLADGAGEKVDIEVLDRERGDQRAAAAVRLRGITYDTQSNALEFSLAAGDHRVYEPESVWVKEESDGFLSAIEVGRPDGAREVVTLRRAKSGVIG